jgi:hypothetical protein
MRPRLSIVKCAPNSSCGVDPPMKAASQAVVKQSKRLAFANWGEHLVRGPRARADRAFGRHRVGRGDAQRRPGLRGAGRKPRFHGGGAASTGGYNKRTGNRVATEQREFKKTRMRGPRSRTTVSAQSLVIERRSTVEKLSGCSPFGLCTEIRTFPARDRDRRTCNSTLTAESLGGKL